MAPELILKKVFYPCSRINRQIMIEEIYTKIGGRIEFKQLSEVSCESMRRECLLSDCQFIGAENRGNYIWKLYQSA